MFVVTNGLHEGGSYHLAKINTFASLIIENIWYEVFMQRGAPYNKLSHYIYE